MSALGSFLKGAGVSLSNQYDTDLSQLREDEALDLRLALQADDPSLRETQRQLRMLSKLEEELRTGGDSQRARIAALRLGVQTASQEETTYQRQLTAGKRSRAGFDRSKATKIGEIDTDEKKAKGEVEKQVADREKGLLAYNKAFAKEMVSRLKDRYPDVTETNWRNKWKDLHSKQGGESPKTLSMLDNVHLAVTSLGGANVKADATLKKYGDMKANELFAAFFTLQGEGADVDFENSNDVIEREKAKVEGGRTEAIETQAEQDLAKVETDTESAIADIEAPTPPGTTALEYAQKYLEYAEGGNLSEADKQKLLADIATDRAKLETKLAKGPDLTEFREQQEERREEFRTQRPYGRFTFKTVRRSGGLEIPQSIREAYESARVADPAATAAGEPGTDPAATAAEQQAERDFNKEYLQIIMNELTTEPLTLPESPADFLGPFHTESSRLGSRGSLGGGGTADGLGPTSTRTPKDLPSREEFEQLTKRVGESIDRDAPFSEEMYLSRALFGKASSFAEQQEDQRDGRKSAEELGFDLQQKPRLSDDDFFAQQMPVRQELSQPGNALEGEERLEISGGLPEELVTQYDKNIKEIAPYLEAGGISKEDYLKELGGGDRAKGELRIAQMNKEDLEFRISRIKRRDVPVVEEEEE